MNCKRIEQLLPLYVGGDLKFSLATRISSHLEWCGRCNWLADDFMESQSWIRSHESPVFDEAFVADLKQRVLEGVAEPRSRASVLTSWIGQWNRRQVLALAATCFVVAGMLALYVYQARVKLNSTIVSRISDAEVSIETKEKPGAVTKAAPGAGFKAIQVAHKRHRSFKPRTPDVEIASRHLEPARQSPVEEDPARANAIEQLDNSSDVPVDSRDMLRIEIQTSDPNIRIIWFSPKEVDRQPTKPLTTTQQ
jgi:hypothetical protein